MMEQAVGTLRGRGKENCPPPSRAAARLEWVSKSPILTAKTSRSLPRSSRTEMSRATCERRAGGAESGALRHGGRAMAPAGLRHLQELCLELVIAPGRLGCWRARQRLAEHGRFVQRRLDQPCATSHETA